MNQRKNQRLCQTLLCFSQANKLKDLAESRLLIQRYHKHMAGRRYSIR